MKNFLLILSINLCLLSTQFFSFPQFVYAKSNDFNQLKSTHFIVNYQQGVERQYASKVKQKGEYFYRKITQEFNLVRDKLWLWDNRAVIFIAKDKEQYLKNFNCPEWSSACVSYWDKIIYTYPSQKNFISILAHELTHIIFREYLKNNNLPLWLDEGMATYIEDKYAGGHYKKRDYALETLINKGEYLPLREVTNVNTLILKNKSDDYVNKFYLQSFSIVNFLVERYQKHRFSQFLWNLKNENNVEKALSKTYYQLKNIDELEKRWTKFYRK